MSTNQMAILIPILGITLSLATAMLFILVRHRSNALELEHRHKERMAAIDRGLDLPMDPVNPATPARPPYLLRGLVWLGVGVAVVAGMRPLLDSDASSIGWIAVAVGVAYLLFYAVEGRKEARTRGNPPSDNSNPGSQS
ncbi:MAG: hypothetical protein ACRETU_11715 [Steroidobacterales bacterium]